jgi:hypothetical protein
MAGSTGPMVLTTAISFGNQWLGNGDLDLKILVAGAIATGGLALISQIPGLDTLATGIAWIAFITLMFTNLGGKPSPVTNIAKLTGF